LKVCSFPPPLRTCVGGPSGLKTITFETLFEQRAFGGGDVAGSCHFIELAARRRRGPCGSLSALRFGSRIETGRISGLATPPAPVRFEFGNRFFMTALVVVDAYRSPGPVGGSRRGDDVIFLSPGTGGPSYDRAGPNLGPEEVRRKSNRAPRAHGGLSGLRICLGWWGRDALGIDSFAAALCRAVDPRTLPTSGPRPARNCRQGSRHPPGQPWPRRRANRARAQAGWLRTEAWTVLFCFFLG